jgi:hypothetical protein
MKSLDHSEFGHPHEALIVEWEGEAPSEPSTAIRGSDGASPSRFLPNGYG